jgi:Lon protease-like protein
MSLMLLKRTAAAAMLLAAGTAPALAQSGCAGAIAQFRAVIDGRVSETCRTGKDAEAMRALAALRSRFGYR